MGVGVSEDVTKTGICCEHNIRPTSQSGVAHHHDITMIATDEGWLYLAG